ncbi:MAG: hypothetical protein RRY34_01195, partial [Victivallaceae bacterium]
MKNVNYCLAAALLLILGNFSAVAGNNYFINKLGGFWRGTLQPAPIPQATSPVIPAYLLSRNYYLSYTPNNSGGIVTPPAVVNPAQAQNYTTYYPYYQNNGLGPTYGPVISRMNGANLGPYYGPVVNRQGNYSLTAPAPGGYGPGNLRPGVSAGAVNNYNSVLSKGSGGVSR